ncbi:MAG: BtpA/SgcQ family protein [Actinomycetota bacterium]|nr:BtpA/SgcQ family protein [Actinomycetota bacterium]
MVHLGPLPGSPRFDGAFDRVVSAAVDDAIRLDEAGFDAIAVENFGDAPFFADDVPKVTVAAMTRVLSAIAAVTGRPMVVNVLRNDAAAALAVAAATGAAFVRVNVLAGTMWTDQGPIVGRAAEVTRLRRAISPEVGILADVFVKHATPAPGATIEQAAEELAERALADAIIVSGTSTGRAPDRAMVRQVRAAAPGVPTLVGSGVTEDTVASYLEVADGVIVGTALKADGITTNPVDPVAAKAFVAAAG